MPLKKMSKDGSTFYDVEDSEESLGAAKAKGYKEYVPMTKNGADVFNVEFTEESYGQAVTKGYKDLERYKFENTRVAPEVSFGGALAKGLGNATSIGDEMTGLAGAIVNPTGSDKGFADRYRDSRDFARKGDDAALDQQPLAYIGGRLVGGVAGAVAAPITNTLGGGVALGGAMGLGDSTADLTKPSLENVGEAALDTAMGAGAGFLGYGAGKAISKLPEAPAALRSMGENAGRYLKAIGRGAARGSKDVGEDLPRIIGINEIGATVGALKGAVAEVKAISADLAEFKKVAEAARRIRPLSDLTRGEAVVIGAGKELGDFTDEEAIVSALLSEGDNPVKQWFATKGAILDPGQIDADKYAKMLAMGPDARNVAREFSPREAAGALKPVIEESQDLFINARNKRFSQLQDRARADFNPADAGPVFKGIEDAIEDAISLKSIPGSTRAVLDDANQMIKFGVATRQHKLNPGKWENSGSTEQFNRLQKARELLDSQIKWANERGHNLAESLLVGVRGDIDNVLKISPDKVEADGLFAASKSVEKNFFDATEFRGGGVDEGKISRLLGDTDQAHRFRSSLEDLKGFANHPDLDPVFKEKASELITQLEASTGTMAAKADLGKFRQAQGPTSPAVERMQSIQGKSSVMQDAVRAPSGFLNSADQFSKFIEKKLGKSLNKLDPGERKKAVQFMIWSKKNPEASPSKYDGVFRQLFPNAENQGAVDAYLKS